MVLGGYIRGNVNPRIDTIQLLNPIFLKGVSFTVRGGKFYPRGGKFYPEGGKFYPEGGKFYPRGG